MLNITPPTGRLVEIGRFGANPGGLKAYLHCPPQMEAGAALVVALHGCNQHVEDFALGSGWLTLADRFGFAVLFAEQQRANNPNLCFNWFEPDDIRRDRGEAASIRQMVDHVVAAHGIDRKRIFITGLSAGGAMANAVLALYPDLFAAGAIIAGLPFGTAFGMSQAFLRMQDRHPPAAAELRRSIRRATPRARKWPRLSVWQGSHDHTVRPNNAELILAQWLEPLGLGTEPDRTETLGGHVHRVWLGKDGEPVLEDFRVRSAGHGLPVATAGASPVGRPGPFMLETDISSTARIARFFGLVGPETVKEAEGPLPPAREKPKPAARKKPKPAGIPKVATPLDKSLRTIVNRALRATRLGR